MKLTLWGLIIAASVLLDRVTKALCVQYLKPIGDHPLIEGWLHLTYVENTGAAFGMLKDQRWLFIVVSTIGITAIAVILFRIREKISPWGGIAMAMIIGGGIGNQIDRILDGYVVDMIYVKIIDFAVFNVADMFVCIGVGIMVICCFTADKWLLADEPKKKNPPVSAEPSPESLENAETTELSEEDHV